MLPLPLAAAMLLGAPEPAAALQQDHAAAAVAAVAPPPSSSIGLIPAPSQTVGTAPAEPTPAAPQPVPDPAAPASSPATLSSSPQKQDENPDSAVQEITVTGKAGATPGDPIEKINAVSFAVMQTVDKALIEPVAHGYKKAVPAPIRHGVHNFLFNLHEPVNILNSLLQFKIGRAVKTLGRFAINSTIGIGGVIDVAKRKPFNIPYKANGLANTLGYYGVKPGPFLFLPLIGSTTVRDVIGRVLDLSLLPQAVGEPFSSPTYSLVTGLGRAVDDRVEIDTALNKARKDSPDPYITIRDAYLIKRANEIAELHNRLPRPDELPVRTSAPEAAPPAAEAPQPHAALTPLAVPVQAPVAVTM